jgi:acetyltransferase-like isoleucine patch superfamily enzyme
MHREKMKKIVAFVVLFFPWSVRKSLYRRLCGYQISDLSYIGFSLIYPDQLKLEDHSRIGHLTICKNIQFLKLNKNARLGALNWVTGFPVIKSQSGHFSSELERSPGLYMKEHSAITSRHLIDCTNTITIGAFSTIAGTRSQLLTHSIDIEKAKQTSDSIEIGEYCFIGTNSVLLKGSKIPDYCVFGAMSLINKRYGDQFSLYGGVPAKRIKDLPREYKYFERKKGYIL